MEKIPTKAGESSFLNTFNQTIEGHLSRVLKMDPILDPVAEQDKKESYRQKQNFSILNYPV